MRLQQVECQAKAANERCSVHKDTAEQLKRDIFKIQVENDNLRRDNAKLEKYGKGMKDQYLHANGLSRDWSEKHSGALREITVSLGRLPYDRRASHATCA